MDSEPLVSLFVIADRPIRVPVLLHALVNQTYRRWECWVLDQGNGQCASAALQVGDARIQAARVARLNDWGMTMRERYAREKGGPILGFPNDDAYYCPVYLERMVAALTRGEVDLAYCDWVFDQRGYAPYTVRPQVGWVDVGGFLVKRAPFFAVGGFGTHEDTGDGQLVERLVAAGYPHVRVPGFFYVKN